MHSPRLLSGDTQFPQIRGATFPRVRPVMPEPVLSGCHILQWNAVRGYKARMSPGSARSGHEVGSWPGHIWVDIGALGWTRQWSQCHVSGSTEQCTGSEVNIVTRRVLV